MKMASINKNSGIVLPTVLWVMVACLVVLMSYSSNIRTNIKILTHAKEKTYLYYTARSGIYIGLNMLVTNKSNYQDYTGHNLFNGSINGRRINVKAKSEVSLLSINKINEKQIVNLLTNYGVDYSDAIATSQRIIDCRDKDNIRHPNGMEDADYYASGYKYGCKDERFVDFEELKLVNGVDEKIFYILMQNSTLYSNQSSKIIRLTSEAIGKEGKSRLRITAIAQITSDNYQPYKIIKWYSNSEYL